MNRLILAVALALFLVPALTGTAVAQTQQYGTEVCVNASNADQAKRLFPNATLHVLPDSINPLMNGWRVVSGRAKPMTDAEEIQLRRYELIGNGNSRTLRPE